MVDSSTHLKQIRMFIYRNKFEFLLIGLLQHLFIGLFVHDLNLYTTFVWPLNMLVIGLMSGGIFAGKSKFKNDLSKLLFIFVIAFPVTMPFFQSPLFLKVLSSVYIIYFSFLFLEVLIFLIRPGYINIDIISAAACGFFLLLEITIFTFELIQFLVPDSFHGLNVKSASGNFIDMVYLSSIIHTSIGFGDILPKSPPAKLAVSLFGIVGQFYNVILVGIIISKFASSKISSR